MNGRIWDTLSQRPVMIYMILSLENLVFYVK